MVSPVQRDYLASGPRGDGSAQYGDDVRHEMTLVADDRAFSVRVGSAQAPRSMTVTVVMDGRLEWTFDEPGWRPLSVGAAVDRSYLWSARRLIVLPQRSDESPELIGVDEDLLVVFWVDTGWVLVCETSVRRVVRGSETSRLEFGDVLERASWDSHTLVVHDDSGEEHRIDVQGRHLSVLRA